MPQRKPVITICSSISFYRKANEIEDQLKGLGFEVLAPHTAKKMRANNDYDATHYKTWIANPDDYDKKAELMHRHFDEVEKGDAILVVNEEKHGMQGYVGGNVLMEMALAFHQRKPIFLWNDIPKDSPFLEELLGMQPIILHGKVEKLELSLNKKML